MLLLNGSPEAQAQPKNHAIFKKITSKFGCLDNPVKKIVRKIDSKETQDSFMFNPKQVLEVPLVHP